MCCTSGYYYCQHVDCRHCVDFFFKVNDISPYHNNAVMRMYKTVWGDLEAFAEWLLLKRYSPKTRKSYLGILRIFLSEIWKSISQIERDDIEKYFQEKIKNGMSISYHKQLTGVLKLFFYRFLEKTDILWNELYPEKWESKLPNILSKQEVKKLLDATENLKHKTILTLIYAGWLRLSECVNLAIQDIDPKTDDSKNQTSKRQERSICSTFPKSARTPQGVLWWIYSENICIRGAIMRNIFWAKYTTDHETISQKSEYHKNCKYSYTSSFLCNTSPRRRCRYPHHPRIPRT